MKHIIALFLIALAANTVTAQDFWKKYTPANSIAKFTVESPGELLYQRDTTYHQLDKIVSEAFYFKGDDKTYMITHLKYPKDYFPKDSVSIYVDDIIDHSIQGSKESLTGRLIYQTEINDTRYQGSNYRIHYAADEKTIKARIFYYQGSLYNLQVACPVDQSMDEGVERFLNSFRLKDK